MHRSDVDRAAIAVLFEFQPALFRCSSGGSVVAVDDRDQVTWPQGISGEVAAGGCGLGFRHRLLTREPERFVRPAADFVVRYVWAEATEVACIGRWLDSSRAHCPWRDKIE